MRQYVHTYKQNYGIAIMDKNRYSQLNQTLHFPPAFSLFVETV